MVVNASLEVAIEILVSIPAPLKVSVHVHWTLLHHTFRYRSIIPVFAAIESTGMEEGCP